jgi:hypothetical protein
MSTHEKVIETPDGTEAKYVYTDGMSNPVYYDGASYWVVLPDKSIEFYS